jgi:hypothetical protein
MAIVAGAPHPPRLLRKVLKNKGLGLVFQCCYRGKALKTQDGVWMVRAKVIKGLGLADWLGVRDRLNAKARLVAGREGLLNQL